MAKIFEIDEAEWSAWLAKRPAVVREMAASHPPNLLYRMKSTGHRVLLAAYGEDRTCSVEIHGEFNAIAFERGVFGVPIDDLEECGLPEPGEPVGAVLTQDEATAAFEGVAPDREARKRALSEAIARKAAKS